MLRLSSPKSMPYQDEAEPMPQQIDPSYLKSVAFLYAQKKSGGEEVYSGTAFFMEVPLPDNMGPICYLVTCNHVIKAAKAFGEVYVRINGRDGKVKKQLIRDWARSETKDLAIAKVNFEIDDSFNPIKLEWFNIDGMTIGSVSITDKPSFGIGTEVFYAGLFSRFRLSNRNYPVARFGTIALMPPEDKIPLNGSLIDGYLIESHSWAGFSGSPVFLYPPMHFANTSPWEKPSSQYSGLFLGVLHGHYDIEEKVRVGKKATSAQVDINSGLAVVSTAQELYDFLMCEESGNGHENNKR
jgi:hypothetical protein